MRAGQKLAGALMGIEKLGPYELQDVLGRGGMGTVYRARDSRTGEFVAVKALAPTYSHDEHFRRRFESEIETLTKLDHRNIVRIISYGQEGGNLYFAMELVDGNSLFMEQKQGRYFDWRQVLDVALQVAAGLRHAHDRGIIHRDLKPGNLLRDANDTIKLTDFGIAKIFGAGQLTGDGNIVGTMDYMAPEQALGHTVTVRTDLYGVGAVMYALLARRPPLVSESIEQSIHHLTSVPPVSIQSIVADVPQRLADLIHRLLEKDPAHRFATAQALIHRLKEIQQDLLLHSQADTSIVSEPDSQDFEVPADDPPARMQTKGHDQTQSSSPATSVVDPDFEQQVTFKVGQQKVVAEEDAVSQGVVQNLSRQPDYFNPVTEQVRHKQSSVVDGGRRSAGRAWPLALALVAVVVLAAFGVWYATRPPSPEQLLMAIEEKSDRPQAVLSEIDRFLELYPLHERAVGVQRLRRFAEAEQYRNALAARARLSGLADLDLVEQQFLEMADLARADPAAAYVQLDRLIELHDKTAGMDEDQLRCIEMATILLEKLNDDAGQHVAESRKLIELALQRAADVQPGDPQNARMRYLAIIAFYDKFDWASDLVAEARDKIAEQNE